MKTLIAYFSRAGENYINGSIKNIDKGNGEVIAEKLKLLLDDATLFKIDPVKPYSNNYNTCLNESKEDLRKHTRPDIKNRLDNINMYDTVYLIYPIYWGTFPVHVFTFLEMYDFSGKVIIPIATHEGSGFGASEVDLRKLLPNSTIKQGTAIFGSEVNACEDILKELIKE